MTQNECISNIRTPGSANFHRPLGNSPFGPCPILNGSDGKVKYQDDLSKKQYYDMIDVDEEYDAAAAGFVRKAHARETPFFFYFCSHHTHVPQFAAKDMTGWSRRGLMGDSLAMLDRSVGRLVAARARFCQVATPRTQPKTCDTSSSIGQASPRLLGGSEQSER